MLSPSESCSQSNEQTTSIPHSACLKVDWCARQHGCCYALTRLTSVHDTLGDRREVTIGPLAIHVHVLDMGGGARGPVVYGHVVVWLVPHSRGRSFLSDLCRLAVHRDGGRIPRVRLARGLGGICADGGRESPCGGWAKGWREQPRSDRPGQGRHVGRAVVRGRQLRAPAMSNVDDGAALPSSGQDGLAGSPAETRSSCSATSPSTPISPPSSCQPRCVARPRTQPADGANWC